MARIKDKKIKNVLLFTLLSISFSSYAFNPVETISEVVNAKAGSDYVDETEGKNIERFLKPTQCRKHYPWGEPRFKDTSIGERSLFICRADFAVQYDPKLKVPLWAMENINKSKYLPKKNDIKAKYQPDSELPSKMQPYIEEYVNSPYFPIQLASHQNIPFEVYKLKDKNPTIFQHHFNFTNTVPMMYDNLAETIWADLEAQVRLWASQKDKLYVTTGVIYLNGQTNGSLPKSKTLIPTHFYKIITHRNSHGTVSYIIPNKEILTNRTKKLKDPKNAYTCNGGPCTLSNFIVPIQEIERLTNIEFYPWLAREWAVKVKLDVNEMFKYERRALENEQ